MPDEPAPILGVSGQESAAILGVREVSVSRYVARGLLHRTRRRYSLDRDEVERLALERWKPGHPYWLSSSEAGQILDISSSRMNQLQHAGRLPGVRRGNHWFNRRHQIQVIANAREVRAKLPVPSLPTQ